MAQGSLQAVHDALTTFHTEAVEDLLLTVREHEIAYEDAVAYRDDTRGKSIPFRLYREGIRHVRFREGTTIDELSDLLVCFKDARGSDEGEDELLTLFWEKDSTHIAFDVVDDFIEQDDDASIIHPSATFLSSFDPRRFGLAPEEERELKSVLAARRGSDSEGDDRFELTQVESDALQAMVQEEKGYFALQDFVGLLLEYMAHHPDPKQFTHALHLIRTLIFSMVENLEFGNAVTLIDQVRRAEFVGMSDQHRSQITELRRSFGDKVTFQVVSNFLKENVELPRGHDVFRFLLTLPEEVLPQILALLEHQEHVAALTDVLAQTGKGKPQLFAERILDKDPVIARTMIHLILKTDRAHLAKHLLRALQHDDEAIRLQTAKTLMEYGDATEAPLLVKLLDETSRNLILLAIHHFAKHKCPEAYPRLLKLIQSKRFLEVDGLRQEQCYRALVLADHERAFHEILRTCAQWALPFMKGRLQRMSAAVKGLRYCDAERRLPLLRYLAARKRSPLSPVAAKVIKDIEREESAGAGQRVKERMHG